MLIYLYLLQDTVCSSACFH